MTDPLKALSDLGVSIWLDDLARTRLTSGGLVRLTEQDHVVGVTTNPSIFSKAISAGADAYRELTREVLQRLKTATNDRF